VKEQASVSHYPAPTTVAPRPLGSAPAAAAQNQPAPGTNLGIASVPNLRDVGGLRSNEYILPAYKQAIDGFVAEGGDPSIPQDLLGVKTEYLQSSFDEVKTQYGSIESYFEKGLGIDKAGQQQLRDRFLIVAQKQ
jgi:hypothetical protein